MKDYRLTEPELQKLRTQHRCCERLKDGDKIKAVYLLGSGWSVPDICEALLIDENTLYRYYNRYKEKGLKGLLKKLHKGSEQMLTKEEEKDLENYVQEHPCQTTKQAIVYAQEEFGVTYSISGMNALLKRLGFVYKKPRPIPGQANRKEQLKFIRKYRGIRNKMGKDDSLFFMDGVHPQHNPLVQYGWFKRGEKKELKTNTRYHRLNINGAVDIDRLDVITQDSKRLDEESTLDFLEKLRRKRPKGRIYLVLDNAGYYDTGKVKAYALACGISLLYLPPYSPNLNVIERLWRFFQKDILYNRYYKTFVEFKEACLKYFVKLRYRKKELRTLLTEKFEIIGS